ncbi:MAG: hypothetical protein AABX84_01715 [Nanoarchaeota archaeon]
MGKTINTLLTAVIVATAVNLSACSKEYMMQFCGKIAKQAEERYSPGSRDYDNEVSRLSNNRCPIKYG